MHFEGHTILEARCQQSMLFLCFVESSPLSMRKKRVNCLAQKVKREACSSRKHTRTNNNETGALRELMMMLLCSRPQFHAHWFDLALQKKDIHLLVVLMCTLTPDEIQNARREYNKSHPKTTLVKQISSKTSNWFHTRNVQYFLKNIVEDKRVDDGIPVEASLVKDDAGV